jgi:hypothetical protein
MNPNVLNLLKGKTADLRELNWEHNSLITCEDSFYSKKLVKRIPVASIYILSAVLKMLLAA